MNIIIKQKEIEAGIKLYLLQQGIQLNGKSVEIGFTAGRKDSGLSAEVEINDAGTTSFIDALIQQQAPVAPVVVLPEVQQCTSSAITQVAKEMGVTLVAEAFEANEVNSQEVILPGGGLIEAVPTVAAAVNALFAVPAEEAVVLVAEAAPWDADEVDATVTVAATAPTPVVAPIRLFG